MTITHPTPIPAPTGRGWALPAAYRCEPCAVAGVGRACWHCGSAAGLVVPRWPLPDGYPAADVVFGPGVAPYRGPSTVTHGSPVLREWTHPRNVPTRENAALHPTCPF